MLEFRWTHAHQIGTKRIIVAMKLEYVSQELDHVLSPNVIQSPKKNQFLLLDEGRMILGKQKSKLFTPA